MTLPAGWEACTDPQSGRTYYQNNLTQATQWEPPGAPPPPPPHAGYAGIPGNPGASAGADYLLRDLQATNRSRCFWQLVRLLTIAHAAARIACTERCIHLTRRCSNHGLPCTRARLASLWVGGHTRSSTARARDLWGRFIRVLTWGEDSTRTNH